ncbi:MAG: DUF4328 domain-containing protein [Polyangiaceae bacterium]
MDGRASNSDARPRTVWKLFDWVSAPLLPLLVASLLAHLLWVHRSMRFARRIGATGVPSAGSAVLAYLIPLANLVYPVRHMRELFRSTAPEHVAPVPTESGVERPYRSSARVERPEVPRQARFVVAWWCAWLVAAVLAVTGALYRAPGTLHLHVHRATLVTLFVALGMSFVLVLRIGARQRAQHRALASMDIAREELARPIEFDAPPVAPRRRISKPPSVFVELERERAEREAARAARRKRRRAKRGAVLPGDRSS